MLVLEFTSLIDSETRTTLEDRLGLHILSEVAVEEELDEPIFTIDALSLRTRTKGQLLNGLDLARLKVKSVESVRTNVGQDDPKKVRFVFRSKEDAVLFKSLLERSAIGVGWKFSDFSKKERETFYRTLIQFHDEASIGRFNAELSNYRQGASQIRLTTIQRALLFDAFVSIGIVSSQDRLGAKLQEVGFPADDFFFDLDLWHTGEDVNAEKLNARNVIQEAGGRVTDIKAIGDMLIIARVEGNEEVARKLLAYDRVSRLDLPPSLPPQLFDVFGNTSLPDTLDFEEDMPLACVVDSGIMPGHPLLRGAVVDSNDFDSGDGTSVDTVGHGTHVAGIVVYGDVAKCIPRNIWEPKVRVINAKVLHKGPFGGAEFTDEKRAETQIEDAIRWAASAYECRVFNLSLGNLARKYSRGHQLPWALLIDKLASELNIVIVVSAGNNQSPAVPSASTRADLRKGVLENIYGTDHSLIDPATAANALTVGSVARSEQPAASNLRFPTETFPPVASPEEAPSAFTRTGICEGRGGGLHRSIKPELVAYGGNYLLNLAIPPYKWAGNDPHLGEPSLAFNFASSGRPFAAACGTSFAAPFVTHIAARVEHQFRKRGRVASLNLIRALVVNSARHTQAAIDFISGHRPADTELSVLRAMGYGKPNAERALFSSDTRVVLYAEDEIADDQYQLYELKLPEEFIAGNDRRRIRFTLAYDPPVRGSRKEYIGKTMWFELFRDKTVSQIQSLMAGTLPVGHKIKSESLTPTETRLEWSTVQSASFEAKLGSKLAVGGRARKFHVLVGSHKRFSGEDSFQRYALVATLEHDKTDVRIYDPVRVLIPAQRITNRTRLRY
ncbi:S8 family peptidase [Hymenobacter sp. B1770]|uniref:S8 family peptidase n=1 Tax=Hymenobacter sp. B1770 TaxID=1718788 RepID=UPI003CFB336C